MPGWLSWASLRASWSAGSLRGQRCGPRVEDLDGHGPVELRVVAEVHRAEAAGPQGAAPGSGRTPTVPSRCPTRWARPVHRVRLV